MGKKINNSLTKKDGNKLGKRKKEREWLKIEFKSKMNQLDIKAFAKDIIESTGERRERLYLPSFAGPVSEILSMDHGIKAGDMACISVVQHTDDMFKSNIMQTAMMHAKENGAHVATMCLEIGMDEYMRRMNKLCNPKIPVDDDFKWEYKPLLLDEADMELRLEKKHDKNVRLETIFMKARACGESIKLTTPIVKEEDL